MRQKCYKWFCGGTDFEGIDKQDLAAELGLIFFCCNNDKLDMN